MTLGYFDDVNREYVITAPQTPYPWINYLGHESFFSLLSNTSGGYSFYKDAKFRRLTRFRYNNVPNDMGGKYFYLKDNSDVWSLAWKPTKTQLDHYECRHGIGYSRIESSKNGLKSAVTYFVPMGENVELQLVSLENTTDTAKNFQLYSLVEWCLWNAEDDMTNFQRNFSTGEVEAEMMAGHSAIYHKTEYRERRNHFSFYAVNEQASGFDTDRDSFLGAHNGFDSPEMVQQGTSSDTIAHGWSPIASHRLDITLAPGEKKALVFILGYAENDAENKWEEKGVINKAPAHRAIKKFGSVQQVHNALDELKTFWDDNLNKFQVKSEDEKLDRMVNTWNQYQCMVTFNFSRSASYFESGIGRGMGFRDSNQDLVGILHMQPERARERILDIAATQKADGSAYHQYQPLTKRGNSAIGGNFNDDPLWLILSVTAYIKETGDFSILEVSVPFDNDEQHCASLFEHLKASVDHVIHNLGPHGLPLIGRADWNDCLNLNCFSTNPDESFQTTENQSGQTAESVMIAGMFVYFGREYVALCQRTGKQDEADRVNTHIFNMENAVNEHGWDGNWFLRAYDSAGEKVGSNDNDEGKIFIESQGFCVMAGLGLENGRALQAMDAVEEHLSCEHGVVLCYPAYTDYQLNLGEISTYPPGYKENGGIFCHNNPWIMIAETKLGRAEKAFEYYKKIAPAYQDEKIELHKTEPYVYAQMIAGKQAFKPGEAKNSWLTGTAAWNYHTITEHIIGIKPDYDGLLIEPCITVDAGIRSIQRAFRGITFDIHFEKMPKDGAKVQSLIINGDIISGNFIALPKNTTQCKVTVKFKN